MTPQRFCLRWNNHQSNLLSVFDQLLQDESFVDVTIAVEGQLLKAHKMVLSACSPYFQALFVNHPDKHPIVILKDVPASDMRSLLDFMYRGEVSVDQDRLTPFLKTAECLRIKGLTEVNEEKCDSIASSLLAQVPPAVAPPPPPPNLHRIHLMQPTPNSLGNKRQSSNINHLLNSALLLPPLKRKRGARARPTMSAGNSETPPSAASPEQDSAPESDSKHNLSDSSYTHGPPDLLEVNMSEPGGSSPTPSDDGESSSESHDLLIDECIIKKEPDDSPQPGPSFQDSRISPDHRGTSKNSDRLDVPMLRLVPKSELLATFKKEGNAGGEGAASDGALERNNNTNSNNNNNNNSNGNEISTSPSTNREFSPPPHMMSPSSCFSGSPPAPKPTPSRRRVRRRATTASDPAEQLTEMSVRGLNLFRYASIDEGVYKCMECAKTDVVKTFKNKYSFQRHAFLYHEGCQRKVFPCPVCGKEFSRPDKMKNHMKTVHECFIPKEVIFQNNNKDGLFPNVPPIPFFMSPTPEPPSTSPIYN